MGKCRGGCQGLADFVDDRRAERPDRRKARVPGELCLLMPQELLGVTAFCHHGAENKTGSGDDNRQELAT